MTRPMPGPPRRYQSSTVRGKPALVWWNPQRHCNDFIFDHELQAKRLTDAECYDEWEAAEEDAWDALADHIRGDKQGHAARFDRSKNAALTWARFATRPHALEES